MHSVAYCIRDHKGRYNKNESKLTKTVFFYCPSLEFLCLPLSYVLRGIRKPSVGLFHLGRRTTNLNDPTPLKQEKHFPKG